MAQATLWYTKSANQNYGPAQLALGKIYNEGQGVKTDIVEAYKWFRLAQLQGVSDAEKELATCNTERRPSCIQQIACRTAQFQHGGLRWNKKLEQLFYMAMIILIARLPAIPSFRNGVEVQFVSSIIFELSFMHVSILLNNGLRRATASVKGSGPLIAAEAVPLQDTVRACCIRRKVNN